MAQCSRCGAENAPGTTFCGDCGRFLDWSTTTAPPAPPAPPPPGVARATPPPVPVPPAPPPSRPLDGPTPPPTRHVLSPPGSPPPPPPPPASPPASRPPVEPQRPHVARPTQQYRLVRKPSDPVDVEPIALDRPASWSGAGVGASDAGHGLYLVVEAHELSVAPGTEVVASVRVRNSGAHVERAVIEVNGLPAPWVTVQPGELNLDVATEGVAVVRFHPPREASTGRGRFPFEFTVWSASQPTVRCSDGAALVVEAFNAVSGVADPPAVASRGDAHYALVLRNDGNRPVTGAVEAADPADALRARAEPPTVELAPGASATVRVVVTPRRRLWTGTPSTHLVALRLAAPDEPMVPVHVQLHQQPVFPRWSVKVLTVAAAVLVLVGGLALRSAWVNRPRAVPSVTQQPKDDAISTLKQKGFVPKETDVASDSVAKDLVVSQSVKAGTKKRAKSTIAIVVSTGPSEFKMANVTGKAVEAAKKLLTDQKLAVTVEQVPSADVPTGAVIDQDPKPDAVVSAGTKAKLTVSSGRASVTVPSLKGMLEQAATAKLGELKLNVQILTAFDDNNVGRVVNQDPPPGDLQEGATVKLTIGRSTTAKT